MADQRPDSSVSEQEISWTAGLFEGEGSIALNAKRTTTGVLQYGYFSLGMTDEDTVRRFQDIMGFGSIYIDGKSQNGYKPMYVWRTNSRENFLAAATLLRPWLGSRRLKRLAEIEALVSPIRRRPPTRRLCKRGHWLIGLNAKPNGIALNGHPKITCRSCINSNYRMKVTKETGRTPEARTVAEQILLWGDNEVIALKRKSKRLDNSQEATL